MRGRSGDCEGEQSRARGSYEASRAAAEPPQNPTSAIGAIGAELAAQSCDEIMNRPSKPIDHPYDGRRANWWATFHNRDLLIMAVMARLA